MPDLRIGPINAATPTPLTAGGRLDFHSAKRLARRWIELQLDGVLLLGNMGEGSLVANGDREAFLDLALSEAGGELTIFVSASDSSRERMREQALQYASMGAPCVVLTAPRGVSAAKAIADVKAVAECCPVPCCYYEVPGSTGVALNAGEIFGLLTHGNIVAMKDSSNNPLLSQALTSRYRVPGVAILDGVEYRAAYSRAVGYDGVIHGGAVLTGRRVRAIWEMAGNGKAAEAMRLDRENSMFLGTVYNRFSHPLQNTIGQKYALKLLGILEHETVLLDQSLDEASKARIAEAVSKDREWIECVGTF